MAEGAESSAGPLSAFLLLVAAIVWVGHFLKHNRLIFLTQGSLALLSGLAAGGGLFLYYEGVKKSHIPPALVAFNYSIYMDLLLPPIIFYAGFSIKKKHFFDNFGAVTTLGVIGTVVTTAVLGLQAFAVLRFIGLEKQPVSSSLALGTIFSSSDSVAALQALDPSTHPQLHALVFGEGVVNDATAIVLLRAVQHIKSEAQLNAATGLAVMVNFLRLSGLSLLLGVGVGLASAFILKITFSEHHSTDREISLLAVLGFLSYLGAESSGLSGVFATFFCGLTMSHYAWHTLSPSAKVVSIYAFRVLSFLAELMLFLFCGLDLWSTSLWHKDLYTKAEIVGQTTMLSAWLIVGSPVTRAIVIGPLVFAVNLLRSPATKISTQDTLALIVAGCGRGAVTLALAMNHFVGAKGAGEEASVENQIIAVACMAAVVFSTVVLGGATPDIIAWLLARDVTAQWRQRIARFAARANGYSTLPSTDPRPSAPVGAGGGNAAGGGASTVPPQGRRVTAGASLVHDTWTKIDRNVLQPFFGGRTISRYRSPPPSPGRWRGAADAISVLQRSTPQPRERPPPPPNVLPSPFMIVEEGDFDASAALPPGEPAENDAEAKTVLEELFSQPGESVSCEDLVDEEVRLEGMVERAETMDNIGYQ